MIMTAYAVFFHGSMGHQIIEAKRVGKVDEQEIHDVCAVAVLKLLRKNGFKARTPLCLKKKKGSAP